MSAARSIICWFKIEGNLLKNISFTQENNAGVVSIDLLPQNASCQYEITLKIAL